MSSLFLFADGNPGDETEMGSKKITIQVWGETQREIHVVQGSIS